MGTCFNNRCLALAGCFGVRLPRHNFILKEKLWGSDDSHPNELRKLASNIIFFSFYG
jgi:hypothetical protein